MSSKKHSEEVSLNTLLFDLGNVIIGFDDDRKCRQMADVTGLEVERISELLLSTADQKQLECGQMSPDAFVAAFRSAGALDFTADDFWTAFCDIFTLNSDLVERLPKLRAAGLRLVIVSNTNAAHMQWEKEHHDFFRYFDARVFSHEVGALKPDPQFYEAALQAAECSAQSALFIDDLLPNCKGAEEFGFQAHHFRGTEGFLQSLEVYGIKY